jgi:hypothetical protein
MAVCTFDPTARSVRAIDVRPLTEAFAGRAAGGDANDRPNRGNRNDRNDRAKQAK